MKYKVTQGSKDLIGEVNLPSSKSESNRVLTIRALCDKDFLIDNLSEANDTELLDGLIKKGQGLLDVGPAGSTMRFLTALCSVSEGTYTLTGSERMKQRPIGILVDALRQMGAEIECLEKEGYPPLKIVGSALEGGEVEVDGSVSSQFISALMMIGPNLKNGLKLIITTELSSMPYVKMTLNIMEYYGIKYSWKDNVIDIPRQDYISKDFQVESDWSGASYWYLMACFSDNVDLKLKGLKKDSLQGDSVGAKIFENFGIQTHYEEDGVRLTKVEKKLPDFFEYDFSDCPDIAQTLACACVGLGVKAKFTGLKSLRIKETDRIKALQVELSKIGGVLNVEGDDIYIESTSLDLNKEVFIDTYDDHRMAMAFAPLGMLTPNLIIDDPMVIIKSYPKYWEDVMNFGFSVEEV